MPCGRGSVDPSGISMLRCRMSSLNQQRSPNRLINETSPYLLQHAHNPVDWYPWGGRTHQLNRPTNPFCFRSATRHVTGVM